MTKIIAAVIILLVLWGGWELFFYWERVKNEQEDQKKQTAAAVINGDSLPGLPGDLENSLKSAQNLGANGLKNWLKAYAGRVQDPRKAWIELDYCLMVSGSTPAEAKRVFGEVKNRVPQSSPVYPRIKEMERTYQ